MRVTARIFNAGLFPAREVPVRLVLDGKSPIEQTITLEGRTRALVQFDAPITAPGLYSGFVEVRGDDELPFDDRRYIAFETRLPERVLLVDGEPGPSVFGNETYYLETALRLGLPGDLANETPPTPYEPVRLDAASPGFELPDLAGFRIVALCNVGAALPRSRRTIVALRPIRRKLDRLPGRPRGRERLRDTPRPQRLARADWRAGGIGPVPHHRLGQRSPDPCSLRGPLARGLEDFAIPRARPHHARARGAACSPRPRKVCPCWWNEPQAAGARLLFAIPCDNAWGEWAIHRLYLPLVHQVAGYLTDRLPGTGHVQAALAGNGANDTPGVAIQKGTAPRPQRRRP